MKRKTIKKDILLNIGMIISVLITLNIILNDWFKIDFEGYEKFNIEDVIIPENVTVFSDGKEITIFYSDEEEDDIIISETFTCRQDKPLSFKLNRTDIFEKENNMASLVYRQDSWHIREDVKDDVSKEEVETFIKECYSSMEWMFRKLKKDAEKIKWNRRSWEE